MNGHHVDLHQVRVAVAAERKRCLDIIAACCEARRPDLAEQHIKSGASVEAVERSLQSERKPTALAFDADAIARELAGNRLQ